MKTAQNCAQDSTTSTKMGCRRRPLHTWGVSTIAITHKAYIKAQALDEPLALMAANLLTLTVHPVSYFNHFLRYFWLSIFFVVDDCILALENMVETVFPSSKQVFDKVDEVIEIIEALPGKFDDVLNELPVIIKQVPFLDWIICLAISWLQLLTSWGLKNTKEKDVVDQNEAKLPVESINDDEKHNKPENEVEKIRVGEMGSINDNEKLKTPKTEAEKIKVRPISSTGTYKGTYKDVLKSKGSYKDVLKRGNRENSNMEKKKKKKMKEVGIQTTMVI